MPLIENSETGLFEDVESVHEAYEELVRILRMCLMLRFPSSPAT